MRIRSGLAHRCLVPLAVAALCILLPACYDDIVALPGDHPCAKCKACQHCVTDGETARCEARNLSAKMRCESETQLNVVDSCGAVTQVMACSADTECLELKDGEAACKLRGHFQDGNACADAGSDCSGCRNQWQGDNCEVCPGNWDAAGGCAACRNQWQGDDCEVCPGNWNDVGDCSACRNRWQGDDCEVCPGNWEEQSDCSACRNRWQGNDCDVCPAHFAAASDCSVCAKHWTGDDCNVCKGHRDPGSDCMACLPGWASDGHDCGTCADGLELDADTDTCKEVCGNGIATATEACDDGNDEALDGCDQCAIAPFTVNTYDGQLQQPSVAAAGDGAFVVVWMSNEQDDDGWGVYGQRFDASGEPVGDEFQVPQNTAGNQTDPKVAMAEDGRFVVVWYSSAASSGLVARQFAANGEPDGDEFAVITSSPTPLARPSISATPDGKFAIAGTTGTEIITEMYSPEGSIVGAMSAGGTPDPGASTGADGASVVLRASGTVVAYVRQRRYLAPGVDSYIYWDNVMIAFSDSSDEFGASPVEVDQMTPALALNGAWPMALAWIEHDGGLYSVVGCFIVELTQECDVFELDDNLGLPDGTPAVAVIGPEKAAFAWRKQNHIELGVATSGGGLVQAPLMILGGSDPALAAIPNGVVLTWVADSTIRAQRYDTALKALGRSALQP